MSIPVGGMWLSENVYWNVYWNVKIEGSLTMAEEKEMCPSCCGRKKHRQEAEYRDLLKRLNRIEGQVRGVKKMLEEDRYCVDILTQVSAINSALNSFNKVLLAEHIKSCVVEDIRAGKEEAVDELCATLQKLMK